MIILFLINQFFIIKILQFFNTQSTIPPLRLSSCLNLIITLNYLLQWFQFNSLSLNIYSTILIYHSTNFITSIHVQFIILIYFLILSMLNLIMLYLFMLILFEISMFSIPHSKKHCFLIMLLKVHSLIQIMKLFLELPMFS